MEYQDFYNIANQFYKKIELVQYDILRNSGYHARNEIEKILDNISDDKRRLEHYGFKVYSQNDEDGIINEIFKRLGIHRGIFCEIGVEDGIECNTHYLLKQGWVGLWVECDVQQSVQIEQNFKRYLNMNKLKYCHSKAMPENINELLAIGVGENNSTHIDFLSIDIDGMDYYLFEALDLKPKVICIEYNSKFPPNVKLTPVYDPNYQWDGTDYMGSSLLSLCDLADHKGYALVGTNITGLNAFFVRNDLLSDLFAVDLGVPLLYNRPRYYLSRDYFCNDIGHRSSVGLYLD